MGKYNKGGKPRMKCPLLCMGESFSARKQGESDLDCLKDECAWWVGTNEKCAINELGQCIVGMMVYLHNISENMPFKPRL